MEITFSEPKPDHAEQLGDICFRAFRSISEKHNFPRDFESAEQAASLMQMMIAGQGIYGVAAESDGRIIGSNFLWEADEIDGVGPITVDPAQQDSSIGRKLMEHVIERSAANGKAGIRLVQAAYHNRSLALYTKLGFDTVEPLSLMTGGSITVEIAGYSVRTMTGEDVDKCDSICREVHDTSRKNEIAGSVKSASGMVAEHNGEIVAYSTLIGFFGHAVGRTNEGLKALIASGREFAGPGFLLPTRNNALMRWCLEHGLRIVQPMTLMAKGGYKDPNGVFLPSILY